MKTMFCRVYVLLVVLVVLAKANVDIDIEISFKENTSENGEKGEGEKEYRDCKPLACNTTLDCPRRQCCANDAAGEIEARSCIPLGSPGDECETTSTDGIYVQNCPCLNSTCVLPANDETGLLLGTCENWTG